MELVLLGSECRPVGERVGARVEQTDGGGVVWHEHHAAVGQQDSAVELGLLGSDSRPAGERKLRTVRNFLKFVGGVGFVEICGWGGCGVR